MQFVQQSGANDGIVQLAAAFAEQSPHVPLLAQPPKRGSEVDLVSTADLNDGSQCLEALAGFDCGAVSRQDDDGGELVFENLGA